MHRRSRQWRGPFVPNPTSGNRDEERWNALARFLADWCSAWEDCGRGDCFRSRRCRGPGVPCFDRVAETCYVLVAESPQGRRLFEIAIDVYEDAAVAGD